MFLNRFNPADYGGIIEELIDLQRLNELGQGHPNIKMLSKLESVDIAQMFRSNNIKDQNFAQACVAGLWLHHDFLDQSHTISQTILNNTGSYWHGIMHRREGDFWNSKYWFRQVGNHPVSVTLLDAIKNNNQLENNLDNTLIESSSWDPYRFVDLVEKYSGQNNTTENILKEIQRLEWQLLFDYSYKKAIGV